MGTRIVQIGKTKWLAGLDWRSFEDTPTKTEIRDDAEQMGMEWYAVRDGSEVIQCGFGNPPSRDVSRPNAIFSLAAMLADSEQQPWLGIFKIEDGLWWYIAVRDGHAILPDGDLIGDEMAIREAQERHSGYGDWNYIEGELSDLAARIEGIKAKKTAVKTLKSGGMPSTKSIAIGAVVAGLVGGYGWWHHHVETTRSAMLTQQMALRKMRDAIAKRPPVVPSPLLSTPDATAWLAACRDAVETVPLSVHGWLLQDVACSTSMATLHWKRGPGATVAVTPKGQLQDEDTINETVPLRIMPGSDRALPLDEAKRRFIASLQKTGIPVQLAQSAAPVLLPGQTAAAVAPTAPKLDFSFSTTLPPFDLDVSVPGLRLNRIQSSGNLWQVGGTLYGK